RLGPTSVRRQPRHRPLAMRRRLSAAPPQGSPAEPELVHTNYPATPQQGPVPSEDPATAPFITLGEPLRGIVNAGVPLYYRVSLKRGQATGLSALMGKTTDK